MAQHRIRFRFRKQGDLRLIGHRDLIRTLERLFRRAGLELAMSEGFHPKPRISFPSALPLGCEGVDEVVELQLVEARRPDDVLAAIGPQCPDGLSFVSAEVVAPGMGKKAVERVVLTVPVPANRQIGLEEKIQQWLARTSHLVTRAGRKAPVDIRPYVETLELDDGALRMVLRVTPTGSVRPRELLDVLGLAELEGEGHFLTRASVELH
ncbi:MAG: TIGR03936 family radical SAM-associated protein [Pirellulales bacterium]